MSDSLAERFGAHIDVAGPEPTDEGFFLVKRAAETDHEAFMHEVLAVVGVPRLLFHHRSGVAVVHGSFRLAGRLGRAPTVSFVGPVSVDMERLQSVLGTPAG